MKKSTKVSLMFLPFVAASFLTWGCGDDVINRTCLDPDGNQVEIQRCEQMYQNNGHVENHPDWFYYWYYYQGPVQYYPNSTRVIVVPRTSSGFSSFSEPEGASFSSGSHVGSVSRGGFGGSAVGGAGE